MTDMLDLAIRGGSVIDGTGSPARRADVGIRDGRIVAIGEVPPAREDIDATGLVVAPGFIDVHTHYDAQIFWDPALTPSSNHGVTTVIGGNCGFSIAPLSGKPDDARYMMRMLSRVEGMPLESLEQGVPWSWTSFADYLGLIEGKAGINAGFMVGHSALRRAVMGSRAVGELATQDEIAEMGRLLAESLAAGGLGLSTTLSVTHNDADGQPVPSRHAAQEEMFALARVVGEYEGTWLEMVADTGQPFSEKSKTIMTEMSRASGRALNWNLLAANSRHKDLFDAQLSASDYAAERGGRVIALAAPHPIGVVLSFEAGMVIDAIPGWAEVIGLPLPQRIMQLSDPAVRRRLNATSAAATGTFREMADWSAWTIVETFEPANKLLEGRTIGWLASALDKTPIDAMLDLAISEKLRTRMQPPVHGRDRESWEMRAGAWKDARTVIGGSDAGAHLDMIDSFAFSTQVLAAGVREHRLIGLEEAVHQMTQVPARTFGLRDRGVLAPGYHADVVVFDPETIGCGPLHSRADLPGGAARLYAEPIGIAHVIVNGAPVHRGAHHTGRLPGKILRSGVDTVTVPVGEPLPEPA